MARTVALAAAAVVLLALVGAVPDTITSAPDAGVASVQDGVESDLGDASLEQIQEDAFGEAIPAPLNMAKKACQAGWLETKKQCAVVTASTTGDMADLKVQIKAAGAAVTKEVLDAIEVTSTSNSTNTTASMEYRSLRLRISRMSEVFERLGESVDMAGGSADETAMKKTLAHMACQALWQQVEQLCTSADAKADDGVAAVTDAVKEVGNTFTTRTETVANTNVQPANSTKKEELGESKGPRTPKNVFLEDMLTDDVDTEVQNLDISTPTAPQNLDGLL